MASILKGAREALVHARGRGGQHLQWKPPNGEALKALRDRLGLNQKQFASKFGLDLATVQNWEQDRRIPERTAAVLLSMIEREPNTVARLVTKARRRQSELV